MRRNPGGFFTGNIYTTFAVCGFLLLAVVLVYGRTIRHEFTNYDDNLYVSDNAALKDGITWKAVTWSFTTSECANWHPITWLSHMLDCQIFDLRPGGHHAVNVALHIANSILLYILLLRMTAAPWPSAMVAALFALHPLHVESVAWVAERKDLLSTMFAMLTILAYLSYVSRPSVIRYAMVFVLLALGLMSKPMLVTLPFVLLLLDYWPLGRWALSPAVCPKFLAAKATGQTAFWLVVEKLPLLVLAAASSVVTYIVQQKAMTMMTVLSLHERLANAMMSYVGYLGKTVWPYPLIVYYPYVTARPWWQPAAAAFFLAIVTVFAVLLWRKRPYLAVGWFWYLGTLAPVIGLVQVGSQSMADRYTYIPLIGIFIMIVWGAADLATGWRNRRAILGGLAAVVTLGCMILTARQVVHWKDSRSLFEYALSISPDNDLAHYNLGVTLFDAGRLQEATEHYEQAIRLKPDYVKAHNNLANVLILTGRPQEAIEHCEQALSLQPDFPETYYNLGNALAQTGRPKEAIEHYLQALRLKPDYAEAQNNLGFVLVQTGRPQEAIAYFLQAVRLKSDYIEVYSNMALAYAKMQKSSEAVAAAQKALELARSQRKTAQAKKLEDWLNFYRAGMSELPNAPPPSTSTISTP